MSVTCCAHGMGSAILAHLMLNERLNAFGMLGCALCIVGSCVIVLHAPPEREVGSLIEIWRLAMQPGVCALLFISFRAIQRRHVPM